MLSNDTPGKIAEIPTGHTKNDGLIGVDLFPGPGIIDGLGQKAGNIDGIGRTKRTSLIDAFIKKSFLYHVLAIIKAALNFQGGYIAAVGG